MKFILHTAQVAFWALLIPLLAGCGRKDAGASAPAPESGTPAVQQSLPVSSSAAFTPAADARLAESQAALKARDYEKAAEALITLQRAKLNEQQAAVAATQMRQLQGSLADALASGDPRAKAAADRLRQSAMAR